MTGPEPLEAGRAEHVNSPMTHPPNANLLDGQYRIIFPGNYSVQVRLMQVAVQMTLTQRRMVNIASEAGAAAGCHDFPRPYRRLPERFINLHYVHDLCRPNLAIKIYN